MKWIKKLYQIEYIEDTNMLKLYNPQGEFIFEFPFNVTLNTRETEYNLKGGKIDSGDNFVSLSDNKGVMKLELNDEDIVASFNITMEEDNDIVDMSYFTEGIKGLSLLRCYKNFSPVPRSLGGINRALYSLNCDCSINGYFSPGPLNFSTGNRSGWVSFGLMDLPDSNEYKFSKYGGIMAEAPCGRKKLLKNETYYAPRLLLTFPSDEWSGIRLFRDKLIEKKAYIPKRMFEEQPLWWKEPMVVTYGDQMMELQYNGSDRDYDSPGYTDEWLDMWYERAKNTLKHSSFTIVVDAFWQHRYSAEPKVNQKTFKNLRKFIDKCHIEGHKVMLWVAPLIDNIENGFETLSQKFGVLSQQQQMGLTPDKGLYCIDFSSDNIEEYLTELSRLFFSDDEDSLNCDGLKLDYLACFHNPEKSDYKNFKNGIGVKEMYRFYDIFLKEARKVKNDVLLNGSACDPRFEEVLCMNRLHDIQIYYPEREDRARISALAAPGTIIDSDGAVMHSDWVKKTYINAVVYSTPALYYIKEFHDRISLSSEEMESLGSLLSLSTKKPNGEVSFIDYGHWQIIKDGNIVAESLDNERVIIFAEDGTGYIFTWKDGENKFPLYGKVPEKTDWISEKDGYILANIKSGKIYTFKYKG